VEGCLDGDGHAIAVPAATECLLESLQLGLVADEHLPVVLGRVQVVGAQEGTLRRSRLHPRVEQGAPPRVRRRRPGHRAGQLTRQARRVTGDPHELSGGQAGGQRDRVVGGT
jgi:hypothetical protein